MAGGYDMIAFHDPRAAPIAMISVSHSSSIEEYMPKLAEKAGLGAPLPKQSSNGTFKYENGQIHVRREQN